MTKKELTDTERYRDILKLSSFSEEKLKLFQEFLEFLEKKKIGTKKDSIPISIFNNDKLTALEAIIKYLREDIGLSYVKIASILKRNQGPIGVTYRKAKGKMTESLDTSSSEISIPFSIFDKKNTVFESLVLHLKEWGISFNKIALLLKRDYRTVWTVYKRAVKKRLNAQR